MTEKGSILVVDDTQAALKLLTEILIAEGYQVQSANSGELALASIALQLPELIMLDIRMPGMDGFEVCSRLKARKESRDIPIIFISAITEFEERVQGLSLGAVDFISKPFERGELLARVRTHLKMRHLQIMLEQQAFELMKANDLLAQEIAERKLAEEQLAEKIAQLEISLARVKQLEGIIPICMYCKKIRDDKDIWSQLEIYISEHSEALFSHGICPDCQDNYLKQIEELQNLQG